LIYVMSWRKIFSIFILLTAIFSLVRLCKISEINMLYGLKAGDSLFQEAETSLSSDSQ